MIADIERSRESLAEAEFHSEATLIPAEHRLPNERRLLLIDDQPSIHDAFRSILQPAIRSMPDLADMEMALFGEPTQSSNLQSPTEQADYHIESAYQGEDGLRLLIRSLMNRNHFDAAVVDMCMPPGWDGIETIRQLWNVHPDLKIIVCTAHSAYSWPDVIALLGRSDQLAQLPKPFSKADAIAVIESITAG